ncbi:hypothetical protein BGZ75_003735 [Mortierella antarctica]|nr:hypothetical protein BGZ75_003735 [Mortierella antarctica]
MAAPGRRLSARLRPVAAALAATPAHTRTAPPSSAECSSPRQQAAMAHSPAASENNPLSPSSRFLVPGAQSGAGPSEAHSAPSMGQAAASIHKSLQALDGSIVEAPTNKRPLKGQTHARIKRQKQNNRPKGRTDGGTALTDKHAQRSLGQETGSSSSSSARPGQGLSPKHTVASKDDTDDDDEEDGPKMRLLRCRATNPLHLPEIRSNVARFLTRKEFRNCLLVCESWWQTFAPLLYTDLRPVYQNVLGSKHEYPSAKLIKKNSHLIKTFEYNGHGSVLLAMIPPDNRPDYDYRDEDLEWRKTEEEEAEEESWAYVDEDVEEDDGDEDHPTSMRQDESLSDFEDRIEMQRIKRESRFAATQHIRTANKRQNETSLFLSDNTNYRSRVCNKIEKLILTDKRYSRDRGCYYKNWIKLMQINKAQLQVVELHYAVRSFEAYRDFFNQVLNLDQLTELTIIDNDIDQQKTKPFLEKLCVKLHRLELRNVRVEYGTPTAVQTAAHNSNATAESQLMLMEKMRSLTLFQVHARAAAFPLDFIKNCPNLVELNFRPQWGLLVKHFSEALTEKIPQVTHLVFRAPGMSDMDASQIIKSVPRIEKLDFSGSVFGMMATNNLTTRHGFSISYLDIRGCNQVTGSMIQRLLGECRHLLSFMADYIKAKDVVCNSVYQNWACIGLRELILDFRGDPKDRTTNLALYQQLGKLTCLEHLDITHVGGNPSTNDTNNNGTNSSNNNNHNNHTGNNNNYNHNNHNNHNNHINHNSHNIGPYYNRNNSNSDGCGSSANNTNGTTATQASAGKEESRNCLTLGLDAGLKELRTLIHLNRFIFRGLIDCDVGLVELQWMAKAWPRLEYIGGKLKEKKMSRYNPNILLRDGAEAEVSEKASSDIATSSTAATDGSSSAPSSSPQSNTSPPSTSSGDQHGNHNRNRNRQQANVTRIKREAPANLMALTLFRLKLHHRIKVVPHPEDKPSQEQQRRMMHIFGEYSEDEQERLRPGQLDVRYRQDFRW